MLGLTLGAVALNQLLLACLSLSNPQLCEAGSHLKCSMVLSDLGCGSGSFDLAQFSCTSLYMCSCNAQTDVLSAVTSLAGGAG